MSAAEFIPAADHDMLVWVGQLNAKLTADLAAHASAASTAPVRRRMSIIMGTKTFHRSVTSQTGMILLRRWLGFYRGRCGGSNLRRRQLDPQGVADHRRSVLLSRGNGLGFQARKDAGRSRSDD